MRCRPAVLYALCIMFGVVGAAAAVPFDSPDGRFTIDFPEAADGQELEMVDDATGKLFAYGSWGHTGGQGSFEASYKDPPEGDIRTLDGETSNWITLFSGRLRSAVSITRDGVEGRDVVVDAPNLDNPEKRIVMRMLVFVFAKRAYTIMFTGAVGTETGAAATGFLNSFRFKT